MRHKQADIAHQAADKRVRFVIPNVLASVSRNITKKTNIPNAHERIVSIESSHSNKGLMGLISEALEKIIEGLYGWLFLGRIFYG